MRLQHMIGRTVLLPLFLTFFLMSCAGGEEMEEPYENENNYENNYENEEGNENYEENEENSYNEENEPFNQNLNLENNVDNLELNQNVGIGNNDLNQISDGEENSDDYGLNNDLIQDDIRPIGGDAVPMEKTGRVVRFVTVDADIYDSSKTDIVGQCTRGEPIVVLLEDDIWAQLSESTYIKIEHLSVKGVARAGGL